MLPRRAWTVPSYPWGNGGDGRGWRRAARGLGADESGNASLEFLVAGLVLLVPIVYLIVALGIVQSQALGVQTGARHLARAVATAPDAETATSRADGIARAIESEYGMDAGTIRVEIRCDGTPSPCPRAGALLQVTVSARAALPLAPPLFGLDRAARVPVEGTSVQRVSQFWGSG